MTRFGAALVGSVAVHASAVTLVLGFELLVPVSPPAKPAVNRVSSATAVDIDIAGGPATKPSPPALGEPAPGKPRPAPRRPSPIRRASAERLSTAVLTASSRSPGLRADDGDLALVETPAPLRSPSAAGMTSPPTSAGPDRFDLTPFLNRLRQSARRCPVPRSGEGEVRFCVGADGSPIDVSLARSTGNFALDDAALHCVVPGAAPFPHTDRCLVVPLAFH